MAKIGYHDKTYNLVGQKVMVKTRLQSHERYQWNGMSVPVEIIAEYPKFLVGLVLPHKQPLGFGPSYPYRIGINKFDVASGNIIINGGSIV